MTARLLHGDCLDLLREVSDVDAVVCDPPYGLKMMGRKWDHAVPGVDYWKAILAAAKPGAHLLAFGGTRTHHRLMVAIEDSGWELRDTLMWVHSQGFPKSLNLDGEWQGWGTALKPAWEPIILARKPLSGTVAANVLEHGTGALNVDGCRIPASDGVPLFGNGRRNAVSAFSDGLGCDGRTGEISTIGRWPANLIHDGSDEVVGLFPESKGQQGDVRGTEPSYTGQGACYGQYGRVPTAARNDAGSAARFFYCAKASKSDRDASDQRNTHPTVKPTDLMRYLCRLITPPGGLILDPFMGSGSTGKAAILEGFRFVGIEIDRESHAIAQARINAALEATQEPAREPAQFALSLGAPP